MKNPFGKKIETTEDKELYYELIFIKPGEFKVYGPLTNIQRAKSIKSDTKLKGFAQVIDNKIVAYFEPEEILVTKTALVGQIRNDTNPKGELNENR